MMLLLLLPALPLRNGLQIDKEILPKITTFLRQQSVLAPPALTDEASGSIAPMGPRIAPHVWLIQMTNKEATFRCKMEQRGPTSRHHTCSTFSLIPIILATSRLLLHSTVLPAVQASMPSRCPTRAGARAGCFRVRFPKENLGVV